MKMRMFSMLLALCLLLSTGVLAASPEAVTGSAQALETGMELTLVLHTATTNGKIAVSYPAELELLETQTGFGDEVLWDVDPAKPGELSLAWISAKDVPAETTALTLTLAGEPGRYTFQVTPQELQRSGTKIDCPAFSVTGQIVHDRPCPSAAFQDLSQTAWYHAGVDYVLERKWMMGMSDTRFCPGVTMRRAMMVTVLYRMAGEPDASGLACPFRDVKLDAWYTDGVCWAAANQIVLGVSADCFDPNGTLTREQMAVLLYRYAKLQEADTAATAELTAFPDGTSVSAWAKDAMQWAVAAGLIRGTQEHDKLLLDPKGGSTRAQVAVILMRFQEEVA